MGIVIRPGLEAYEGSLRNGITSKARDRWDGSFVIVGPPSPARPFPFPSPEPPSSPELPPQPSGGPWAAWAMEHRGADGQEFEFECPPHGAPGPIWGTTVYTDDSSVCTAAVHAGVITLDDGGTVRIVIRAGLARYEGSSRNGITSVAPAVGRKLRVQPAVIILRTRDARRVTQRLG